MKFKRLLTVYWVTYVYDIYIFLLKLFTGAGYHSLIDIFQGENCHFYFLLLIPNINICTLILMFDVF